jgi:hypothetical protein
MSEGAGSVGDMNSTDIKWNEEARAKVLTDADNVLREAVLDLNGSMQGSSSDEIYAALNDRLKDRFIDYEPGPDVRKYADAIAAGEIDA